MKTKNPSLALGDVARLTPGEQVVSQLREWIRDGSLAPGKKLPSERVLAERLGVGRTVVRTALAELENEGVVETHPRRGRVVAARVRGGESSLLQGMVLVLVESNGLGPVPKQTEPGWHDFIRAGVLDGILRAELGALTVAGDRIGERHLDELLADPPRGVIAICDPPRLSSREKLLDALHLGDVPVVAYGDEREWSGCDVVVSDHRAGARALTAWLIEQGCRSILRCRALKTDNAGNWLKERDAGFEEAVAEAGLTMPPACEIPGVPTSGTPKETFEMTAHMFAGYLSQHLCSDDPVDALMAASDGDVSKLAAACRILGKDPERDVAIVGYDNYWREVPEAEFDRTPPRATVDKGNWRIGQALVQTLLDRIAGKSGRKPVRCTVEPELIVVE